MDPYANINAEYFVAVHMQITTGKVNRTGFVGDFFI